jgi:hypothetical protein
VIINNGEWRRGWVNRNTYVHPYTIRRAGPPPRIEERHELRERDARERAADRNGNRRRVEDHRGDERREERRH